MLSTFRLLTKAFELLLALPVRAMHFLFYAVMFNPRLGPLRYVASVVIFYVLFAVLLTYVMAPIRGYWGEIWLGQKLQYDSERWLATAIYDAEDNFVGTFDARLDSRRDVNYTGAPIALESADYVANPDHKSIPVREVPPYYWRCLLYQEDRRLGSWLNPFGIDLLGVLKIPVSTLRRSLSHGRPSFGTGGSTLPMQLVRVVYKTPPRWDEGVLEKIGRKVREWWLAPVIYRHLTRGGDMEPLRRWAADHLWLAQRAGGPPLHGVETTARIVFGKEARDLTIAEQFVLASAVNKPIILLEGSERLNRVRLDRWRYITDVRARKCAEALLDDPAQQKSVLFELVSLGSGPPDPKVQPKLQQALEQIEPRLARLARANPALRANLLIPAARYGVREEMKADYGFGWREYVRGVHLAFDVAENRAFRRRVLQRLAQLQKRYARRMDPEFTLDVAGQRRPDAPHKQVPDVILAAADAKGRIVRYFEAKETAAYFGSPAARNARTGAYEPEREGRAIASIGKIIAAIAIANQGRDTADTLYVDGQAPRRGLETCRRTGSLRRGRKARTVFACSLSRPLEWRTARLGQARIRVLIDGLGFNMPPAPSAGEATPPSTAAVRGLITGSPRKVHQLAAVVLAALTGRGTRPVPLPSLVARYERSGPKGDDEPAMGATSDILPARFIRPHARGLLRTLLSAPLCYTYRTTRHGTLKSLGDWCAARRKGVSLHFAKTGTHVTEDPNATVDIWAAGGIRFDNGAAYSYVVLVGTGNPRLPFARRLHAAQIAAPLLRVLLEDLEGHAKAHPPPRPVAAMVRGAAARPGSALPGVTGDAAAGTAAGRWAVEAFDAN